MNTFSRHILATLASTQRHPTSVLDAGCGDGTLISAIYHRFGGSVCGYDISDRGLAPHHSRTIESLSAQYPNVPWHQRIKFIPARTDIPFTDNSFDAVVSKMVLEHVIDLEHFAVQTLRVLKPGGVAIHCFPTREIFWEAHIQQPLTHRFPNQKWMNFWFRLGLGRKPDWSGWPDYFANHTAYRSLRETLACFGKADTSYTAHVLMQRISPRPFYRTRAHIPLLQYLFPVTMVVRKAD